jgi:hypothetical protein
MGLHRERRVKRYGGFSEKGRSLAFHEAVNGHPAPSPLSIVNLHEMKKEKW